MIGDNGCCPLFGSNSHDHDAIHHTFPTKIPAAFPIDPWCKGETRGQWNHKDTPTMLAMFASRLAFKVGCQRPVHGTQAIKLLLPSSLNSNLAGGFNNQNIPKSKNVGNKIFETTNQLQ